MLTESMKPRNTLLMCVTLCRNSKTNTKQWYVPQRLACFTFVHLAHVQTDAYKDTHHISTYIIHHHIYIYVYVYIYVMTYIYNYIILYIYYLYTIVAAVGSIARSFFVRWEAVRPWSGGSWGSPTSSAARRPQFFLRGNCSNCFYVLCMCHGQNMVFGGEKSHPVIHPMGILNNSYRYINPDECILV